MLISKRAQLRRGVREGSGKAARDSLPSHGPPARKERLSVLEEVTESGVEAGFQALSGTYLMSIRVVFLPTLLPTPAHRLAAATTMADFELEVVPTSRTISQAY